MITVKKIRIIILTSLIILSLTACSNSGNSDNNTSTTSSSSLKEITITTNTDNVKLNIEIADTQKEREQGLMNRTSMPQDQGMLFVFEVEQEVSFWMKNTLIPLDIIYADKNGKIVSIAKNTKVNQTSELYPSQYPVKYAIEVNANWSDANKVSVGNIINLQGVK